jgi:Outer membrane protein beta-barrel domain
MRFIFCFLLLIPAAMNAQDSTSKVMWGVAFGNDMCYRLSKADAGFDNFKSEFDSLESAKYGYSAGLTFSYAVRSNWTIQSGLNFSEKGYRIDTLKEASLTNMKFHFRYVELPVTVGNVFNSKRAVKPCASMGVYVGYLLSQRTTYTPIGEISSHYADNSSALSNVNLGLVATLGMQTTIQSSYLFKVEAMYKQSLLSLSDGPFNRYLNSLGVVLSLQHSF